MTAKTRPWFRFSLRTMFVVVTALCCYLAWEMSIVRQRQSLLAELRTQPFVQVLTTEAWVKIQSPGPGGIVGAAHVARTRQWLGDEAIQEISYARGYHHLSSEQIDRLKRVFPEANVHEYEALMEPCHPGCFPRGTLVQTQAGARPIESVQVGDPLTALLPGGRLVTANVQSIFVTKNRLWTVETDDGMLLTTETQPLVQCSPPLRDRTRDRESPDTTEDLSGRGAADYIWRTVPAGDLAAGDQILRFVDGELRAVTVRTVSPTDRLERVFNLVLGDSQLFIAGGFLARSKPPAE